MTLKHTPGPWRISPESDGTYIRASHGGLVASMESGNQLMRDLDARLISAAPDLLAALQGNLEYLELKAQGFLRDYPPDHCINLTVMRQLDATRAAIRKATGQ